jgi:hypothetical protein
VSEDYPSRELDQFLLRLPEGMRDQIAAAAKSNNRTMTAEMVSRLQKTFDAEKSSLPKLKSVSFLRKPAQFGGEHTLAEGLKLLPEVVKALANLEAGLDKQSKRLEKRLERLEETLLTAPRVPKDALWPLPRVKSQKP